MSELAAWIHKRRCTLSLAAFFCIWYALQLSVAMLLGENVARWWFYIEQPPDVISPGIVFAPISHDINSLTHIGANLLLLIVAGGLSEPYIRKDQILVQVIGLGYLGIFVANSTIFLHYMWIEAGASGGILALWAYAALRMHKLAAERIFEGLRWSRRSVETVGVVSLIIGTPVIFIHEAVLTDPIHSGHTIGILLGCFYYMVESYLRPADTVTGDEV
ncbi:hypothetical protein [Natronomonas gomsonensis]|uniref:hypothetical protein n=1 Tax=Natronomonas gomsonensis TaxID=1046043 RepID=UPI0015BA8F7C|nr:hypothetical protein [Natronomonas gomsonensis]